jgi:hypothetical protein
MEEATSWLEAEQVLSITVGELRDIVYELRYAWSVEQSMRLAQFEREHGLDIHGDPQPWSRWECSHCRVKATTCDALWESGGYKCCEACDH